MMRHLKSLQNYEFKKSLYSKNGLSLNRNNENVNNCAAAYGLNDSHLCYPIQKDIIHRNITIYKKALNRVKCVIISPLTRSFDTYQLYKSMGAFENDIHLICHPLMREFIPQSFEYPVSIFNDPEKYKEVDFRLFNKPIEQNNFLWYYFLIKNIKLTKVNIMNKNLYNFKTNIKDKLLLSYDINEMPDSFKYSIKPKSNAHLFFDDNNEDILNENRRFYFKNKELILENDLKNLFLKNDLARCKKLHDMVKNDIVFEFEKWVKNFLEINNLEENELLIISHLYFSIQFLISHKISPNKPYFHGEITKIFSQF